MTRTRENDTPPPPPFKYIFPHKKDLSDDTFHALRPHVRSMVVQRTLFQQGLLPELIETEQTREPQRTWDHELVLFTTPSPAATQALKSHVCG